MSEPVKREPGMDSGVNADEQEHKQGSQEDVKQEPKEVDELADSKQTEDNKGPKLTEPEVNGGEKSATPGLGSLKSELATPNPKRMRYSEEPEIARESKEPMHEIVGGSSLRQYLNKHLTVHVLEGLRYVGNEQPEQPVRALAEFLLERANQIES